MQHLSPSDIFDVKIPHYPPLSVPFLLSPCFSAFQHPPHKPPPPLHSPSLSVPVSLCPPPPPSRPLTEHGRRPVPEIGRAAPGAAGRRCDRQRGAPLPPQRVQARVDAAARAVRTGPACCCCPLRTGGGGAELAGRGRVLRRAGRQVQAEVTLPPQFRPAGRVRVVKR